MVAVSGSPPVARGGGVGQLADHAGLDQCADHDEQTDEEQQGLPFHAGHEVARLGAGQQHQEPGAEQRHHGRLDVEDGVADEAGEDARPARRRR